jgi:hypothetical protein
MMLSNDSIINPPYTVTPEVLKLVADIFTLLGMMQSNKADRPVIKLCSFQAHF